MIIANNDNTSLVKVMESILYTCLFLIRSENLDDDISTTYVIALRVDVLVTSASLDIYAACLVSFTAIYRSFISAIPALIFPHRQKQLGPSWFLEVLLIGFNASQLILS